MIEKMNPDHGAELEDHAEEFIAHFREVANSLTRKRDAEIGAAMDKIDAEQIAIAVESATVADTLAEMRDRLPAMAKVALADADRLLAEGKREEAETKRTEAHDANLALAAMERRMNELEVSYSEIENSKTEVAAEIRRRWAERDVMPVLHAAETSFFLDFLDQLEDGENHDEVHALFTRTDHPHTEEVKAVARRWYPGEGGVTRTFWYRSRR